MEPTDLTIETKELSRRNFIKGSFIALLSILFAWFANVLTRYLLPQKKMEAGQELSIPLAQIPLGSSLIVEYKGAPVIVTHTDQGVRAFKAVCTHLGCIVKWERSSKVYFCPCHAAKFDLNGLVLSGPPPEPLHKIKIDTVGENIIFL